MKHERWQSVYKTGLVHSLFDNSLINPWFSYFQGWPPQPEQNAAAGYFWSTWGNRWNSVTVAPGDTIKSHASDRGAGGSLGWRLQDLLLQAARDQKISREGRCGNRRGTKAMQHRKSRVALNQTTWQLITKVFSFGVEQRLKNLKPSDQKFKASI